jgi:hypothetical protein
MAYIVISQGPHAKQEDVGKMLQFLSIRGMKIYLCTMSRYISTTCWRGKAKLIIFNTKVNIGDKVKQAPNKKELQSLPFKFWENRQTT